jgi:hypothetical protein
MRRFLAALLLASSLAAAGCPQAPAPPPTPPPPAPAPEAPPAPETPPPAEGAATDAPAEAKVYDVVCGCAVPEVGKCSEWAVVDGAHVEITGDLGLGSMPFCGKTGLKAKIVGTMADGKLAATSLELVK